MAQSREEKLEQELNRCYEIIRIMWNCGTFSQSVASSLSEETEVRKAIAKGEKKDATSF